MPPRFTATHHGAQPLAVEETQKRRTTDTPAPAPAPAPAATWRHGSSPVETGSPVAYGCTHRPALPRRPDVAQPRFLFMMVYSQHGGFVYFQHVFAALARSGNMSAMASWMCRRRASTGIYTFSLLVDQNELIRRVTHGTLELFVITETTKDQCTRQNYGFTTKLST